MTLLSDTFGISALDFMRGNSPRRLKGRASGLRHFKVYGAVKRLIVGGALVGAALCPAQAPLDFTGTSVLCTINSGTLPFASSGYFLFVAANTGNALTLTGYGGVGDATGTYNWSRASDTAGTLTFVSPQIGTTVADLSFTGAGGTFRVTSATYGGQQTGSFVVLSASPPTTSLQGIRFHLYAEAGGYPYASAGEVMFIPTGGGGYKIQNIWGSGNTSGTFTYGWANRSTARLNMQDNLLGGAAGYFGFSSPTAGSYSIRRGLNGGYQIGRFEVVDTVVPTVKIMAPVAWSRVPSGLVNLQGTAADNFQLSQVWVRLNNESFVLANGTSKWSLPVVPVPGTNTVEAYAVDTFGGESRHATTKFICIASDKLILEIAGNGTVSPAYGGQMLQVGKKYRLTATPGAGQLFGGWSGGIASTGAVLDFMMQSNLVLKATFVPNPFIPRRGTYSGLIYTEPGGSHEHAGSFSATVTDKGAYSGKIIYGGFTNAMTGAFNLAGESEKVVTRGTRPALTLHLSLSGDDLMAGTVTENGIASDVLAYKGIFNVSNPCPYAGRYGMVFPGDSVEGEPELGHGYATATVDAKGSVRVTGFLADGTPLTQSTVVSKTGYWPLFVPMFKGGGSVLGWLTFNSQSELGVMGTVLWTRPAMSTAKLFPRGMTNRVEVVGSRFVTPVSGPVIPITEGAFSFQGGNLAEPFTNAFVLTSANRIVNTSSNKLVATVVRTNGLFSGSVTVPGTTRSLQFKGILLQRLAAGYGYFLGTNQSGRVELH